MPPIPDRKTQLVDNRPGVISAKPKLNGQTSRTYLVSPPLHKKRRKRKRLLGLTRNQIKFLRVLYNSRGPLSRRVLCDRARCHISNTAPKELGRVGVEERQAIDLKIGYPCLLTLEYVAIEDIEVEGKREEVYYLTPSGIKAYEDVLKLD